jgi:signal peptidase I
MADDQDQGAQQDAGAPSGASKWDRYFADLTDLAAPAGAPEDTQDGAPADAPPPLVNDAQGEAEALPDEEPAGARDEPLPFRPRLVSPPLDSDAAPAPEPLTARFAPPPADPGRWERMFADLTELAAPQAELPPTSPPAEEPSEPAFEPAVASVADFPVAVGAGPPAREPGDPAPPEPARLLAFDRSATEPELPPPPAWVVALKDRAPGATPGSNWRSVLGEQPAWRVAPAGGGAASMAFPAGARPRSAAGGSRVGALIHGAVEALEVLALALIMFVAVRAIAQNFVVDGGSMEPTFANGEMLIVNKLAYRTFNVSWLPWTDETHWQPFGTAQSGDIVVFRFPQNPSRDFIKRVIATAGQTVEVRSGVLMVNGVPLKEPYLSGPAAYEFGPVTVPEGQVFVLGDNRNNSYDSHSWGTLEERYLIGRAELRYWPLNRTGRVDHAAATEQPGASQSLTTAR